MTSDVPSRGDSVGCPTTPQDAYGASTVGALIILNIVATASFAVLPTLIEGATQTLRFSPAEVGALSSLLSVGMAIGSLCAKYWVRRVTWPAAARAVLLGLIVANVLSIFEHQREMFLGLQFLGGVFGGSLLALTLTGLSDSPRSHRDFGLLMIATVIFQAMGLYAGPTLLRFGGINALLAALTLVGALSMLLTKDVSRSGRAVSPTVSFRSLLRPATLTALIGCFWYWLTTACYWTFIGLIGDDSGLSPQQVGSALSIGMGAGLMGGLIASFGGVHFRRGPMILLGTVSIVISVVVLDGHVTYLDFVLSGCFLNFAWNLSVPYQWSVVNSIDTSGHAIGLTPAFQATGAVVGPAVAAAFVTGHDYRSVLWIVAGGALISQTCFVLASRLRHRA
jgi:DHA1 family inner membrane transport protein